MKLRQTLSFFPTEAIRRVIHMHHACSGGGSCGAISELNKAAVWRHRLTPRDTFLFNQHHHGVL